MALTYAQAMQLWASMPEAEKSKYGNVIAGASNPQAGPATRDYAQKLAQSKGFEFTPPPMPSTVAPPPVFNEPTFSQKMRGTYSDPGALGGRDIALDAPRPPQMPAVTPPRPPQLPSMGMGDVRATERMEFKAPPTDTAMPPQAFTPQPLGMQVIRDATGRVTSAGNTSDFAAKPGAQDFSMQRGGFVSADRPAEFTPMYPETARDRAFMSEATLAADDPLFRERFNADVKLAEVDTRAQGELAARVAAAQAAEQAKVDARIGPQDRGAEEWLADQIAQINAAAATPEQKANAIRIAQQKAAAAKRQYRMPISNGMPVEDPLAPSMTPQG